MSFRVHGAARDDGIAGRDCLDDGVWRQTVSSCVGLGKKKIDGLLYDTDLGNLPNTVELLEGILEIASA